MICIAETFNRAAHHGVGVCRRLLKNKEQGGGGLGGRAVGGVSSLAALETCGAACHAALAAQLASISRTLFETKTLRLQAYQHHS